MFEKMCQQVSIAIKNKWVLNSLRQGTGAKHFKDLYNSLIYEIRLKIRVQSSNFLNRKQYFQMLQTGSHFSSNFMAAKK